MERLDQPTDYQLLKDDSVDEDLQIFGCLRITCQSGTEVSVIL
jgi:hypothetical protein